MSVIALPEVLLKTPKPAMLALAVTLLALGNGAQAQRVGVEVRDCATGVHLVSEGAPLSEVFRRLSADLDFQLYSGLSSDPVVTTSLTLPPLELVKKLWPDGIVVMQKPDPRCSGRHRVAAVWLLDASEAGPTLPVVKAAPPPPAVPEPPAGAEQANHDYLRAHGLAVSD